MSKWRMAVWVLAVAAVGLTGCKGSRFRRGSAADTNIGGVTGTPIDTGEYGLGDYRTEGGTEVAGQFGAVYFGYDSSQILPSERAAIETVADFMRRHPSVGLIVEGHCDERGSAEYNLALGERRGLAARAYLIGLGIDGARVQTRSFGEESPVAMGHDEASWRLNRRAEFTAVE